MNERQTNVAQHCNGVLTSKEISLLCGDNHKYVQEVALKFDLPRRKRGSAFGSLNGSYEGGRKIDLDGYNLVSAPFDHPYARKKKNRNTGIILEHRFVVEKELNRYLLPSEIVDHIDGLRLNNEPLNLRLFGCNSEHLKMTLKGQIPQWSKKGRKRMGRHPHKKGKKQIDRYQKMKKSGDARQLQILLALLQLGQDSPYLSGSFHHLTKAGIFDLSRSSLKHELALLFEKWELDQTRYIS